MKETTISFRLEKELKEHLEKRLKGQSFADFVKEGLGAKERVKKTLKEAHDEGYNEGYNNAVRVFGVHTSCAICGIRMVIGNPEHKRELSEFAIKQGWYCAKCADAFQKWRDQRRRRREHER